MPSTFDLDPQSRLPVVTNWTDSLNSIVEAMRNSQKEKHDLPNPMALMEIDATWADVLNANKALSRVLVTALDVGEIGYPVIDSTLLSSTNQALYDGQYITLLTGSLNAAVTVALANSGTSMNTFLMTTKENTENAFNASHPIDVVWSTSRDSNNDDTLPSDPATASKSIPPEVYELSINVERFGYGFGTRSPTATYAFTIIYIYMAVLTIYACYAVYDQLWKNPDRVQSWNKVHDIVTLAMNSTPPEELLDCGAGITDNRTWGKNVKIRANEDHTVELVFKDRPDLRLVKRKEKYG
ncbi:hypothetical protein GJ744_006296 [Endocarpon pusillum]|uniref:Uncharacterized protein n=1 Tax=Endocarpon pusillum TaxID=364733 RepID=A0A8H7A796_9EURO|nr:hypothetical protein GJ744_006296 [Endocarpon pusillum]